jgi:protein-tyrosine-phosphatase
MSQMAGMSYDVPDPYGGPRGGYEEMVKELRELVERGGPRVVSLLGPAAEA